MPFALYQSEAPTFNYVVAETVAATVQNGMTYNNVDIKDVSSVTTDDASSSTRYGAVSRDSAFGASSSSLSVVYSLDITGATAFGGKAAGSDDGYGDMGSSLVTAVNDGQFTATLQSVASSVGASGFANVSSSSIAVAYAGSPTLAPTQSKISTFAPTVMNQVDLISVVVGVIVLVFAIVFGREFFCNRNPKNQEENSSERIDQ